VVNGRKWLLLVAGLLLAAACRTAQISITNTPVPAINGQAASFDAIEIDQAGHRLYAADRTDHGIDVFDISTAQPKFVETIQLPANPNGLAIAPDLGRLFVGTVTGSVVIVDIRPATQAAAAVIKEVPTGGKQADLLDYAAPSHVLYASNSVDGTITSLDATTGDVKSQIKIGYALEQPRFNPLDGMLYVTSPDAGALFQVDPVTGMIKNKTPLGGCLPKGLAINPHTDQALIACHDSVVSLDLRAKTSGNFNQVYGGDVVTYDAKVDRFFVAVPGQAHGGEVGMFGGNPIDYISSVPTDGTGNSAAYDETNDVVYTPDTRPKTAGLTSFRRPADDQLPSALLPSLAILGIVLVTALTILFLVARMGGPRPQLETAPAIVRPKGAARIQGR
jgi:hypothetical protein